MSRKWNDEWEWVSENDSDIAVAITFMFFDKQCLYYRHNVLSLFKACILYNYSDEAIECEGTDVLKGLCWCSDYESLYKMNEHERMRKENYFNKFPYQLIFIKRVEIKSQRQSGDVVDWGFWWKLQLWSHC